MANTTVTVGLDITAVEAGLQRLVSNYSNVFQQIRSIAQQPLSLTQPGFTIPGLGQSQPRDPQGNPIGGAFAGAPASTLFGPDSVATRLASGTVDLKTAIAELNRAFDILAQKVLRTDPRTGLVQGGPTNFLPPAQGAAALAESQRRATVQLQEIAAQRGVLVGQAATVQAGRFAGAALLAGPGGQDVEDAQITSLQLQLVEKLRRQVLLQEQVLLDLQVQLNIQKKLTDSKVTLEVLADQQVRASLIEARLAQQDLNIDVQLAGLNDATLSAKREALRQERLKTRAAQRAADQAQEEAQIRASGNRLQRLAISGGVAGGVANPIDRAGGFGSFFGGGIASTLRFAIPSTLLFGSFRAISEIVREAEELEQVFVRLDAQFQSLGSRGVFGGSSPEEQIERTAAALENFKEELLATSRETGIAADQTASFGQQFLGLFSSIGSGFGADELAAQATQITNEFSVIAGLDPKNTFDDLSGSIRSFADTGQEAISLLDQVTDAVINVSDATGVSAAEITDFVGRIGPAAAQAELEINEVVAIGATALQGSGVGGAALAEQFSRILTGLQGELGGDLSRLALEFESAFSNIDLGGGRSVADQFNISNIAAGETRQVLLGLINGFDSLSESQQRQIIASIGSRREGATLAAVLQNVSTFTTALNAQTTSAVTRQERFADIIDRLTGRLSRLRVEFTQLGLRLFDAGLRDVLSGLLTGLGGIVQVIGGIAEGFILFGETFESVFGEGSFGVLIQVALALGAINVANRVLLTTTNAAGVSVSRLSLAYTGLTGAVSRSTVALSTNIAAMRAAQGVSGRLAVAGGVAARGFAALGSAINPVTIAVGLAFVAFNRYRREQARAAEEQQKNLEVQRSFAESIVQGDNVYARSTAALERYTSALRDLSNAAADADVAVSGSLQGLIQDTEDPGATEGGLRRRLGLGSDQSISAEIENIATEITEQQSELLQRGLSSLTDLQGRLSEGIFGTSFDPLASVDDAADKQRAEAQIKILLAEARRVGAPSVIIDALEDSLRVIESGTEAQINQSIAELNVLANSIEGARSAIQKGEDDARELLFRVFEAGDIDLTRLSELGVDSLPTSRGGFTAVISRLSSELGGFAEVAAALGLLDFEVNEAVFNAGVESFEQTRQKFEAGLITRATFLEAAQKEVNALQRVVNANTVANNTSEGAIEQAEALVEVEEIIAQTVVDRAEDLIEAAELLGSPLSARERADLLIAEVNANLPELTGTSQLVDISRRIVEQERLALAEAISRAGSVTQARILLASSGQGFLDAEQSAIVTRGSLAASEDAQSAIDELSGVTGRSVDEITDELVALIEGGADVTVLLRERLQAELSALQAREPDLGSSTLTTENSIAEILRTLDLTGFVAGTDVGAGVSAKEAFEQRLEELNQALEEEVASYQDRAELFRASGLEGLALAEELRGALVDVDAAAPGSSAAIAAAIELAEKVAASRELQGQQARDFADATAALFAEYEEGAEQAALAGLIQQRISQSNNAFNQFIGLYIQSGTALFNTLLRNVSELVALGFDANEAIEAVAERSIALIQREIARINALAFSGGITFGSAVQSVAVLTERLAAIEALAADADSAPPITVGGITPIESGSGEDAAERLREAQEALDLALLERDPLARAEKEVELAQAAVDRANNQADRLQAQAALVRADNAVADAIQALNQSKIDLLIAEAEQAGNIEEVFRLGVQQAQDQLDFLNNVGAGAAEINAAQIALINAQREQQEGLVQAQLGELGFLFNIGDLSTQAYITALQGILDQLDPVADVDLWRQISLQIKGLKESSNELQFNLPDSFDLPTLYEVRRLNQGSFDGTDALQLGTSTTDNRQYSIEINVQTGMDWEDARNILADALGADTNVFSLGTRRY